MRIAYFNANLRKGQDCVTRVMYKMFEGALGRSHEVLAIASTLTEPQDRIVPMMKVPSVALPLQKNYRSAVPGYQSFARRLNQFRPDLLHINSPCTLSFAAAKYGHHFNIPVVATHHTHFPTYPRYYKLAALEDLTWKLSRHLYNSVDRTFVPTLPILEELREHNIARLEYLPNGVDLTLFSPSRRSMDWQQQRGAERKPVVLFVSRLVWEKDLAVLAHTCEILRSKGLEFEMVIVGDEHAREEFEKMVPGAHFLGYQSGEMLAESYASSDVFLFPSTTETFGLVTLEAMASGLAPVTAKVGGAAGIIKEGKSGLFAAPLNAAELADAVSFLLTHPDERRRIAAAAVRRAQEFSWDGVLQQLFGSYESVLAAHQRSRPHAA